MIEVESFILNQLPSGAFPWDLAQAFSLGAFSSKPWGGRKARGQVYTLHNFSGGNSARAHSGEISLTRPKQPY